MRVYMIQDQSLDIYMTTYEDAEEGNLIRPDSKYLYLVDYHGFLELESKFMKKKAQKIRSTKTIFTEIG